MKRGGHGALGARNDLLDYLVMLQSARDELGRLRKEGKTRQQVIDLRPLGQFDAEWAGAFSRLTFGLE